MGFCSFRTLESLVTKNQMVAKYLSSVNTISNATFAGYSSAQVVGLYTVYTFTGNGSFTFNAYNNITLNVLAIAGGGAGGGSGGGGGGAGGMVQTSINLPSGTADAASITIGTGGIYGTNTGKGNDSSIAFNKLTSYNITAFGGGGGGSAGAAGSIGGSGGGSGVNATNAGGSIYITSQGNAGGANNSATYSGGSGGGGSFTVGGQSGNAQSGDQLGQYTGNGGNGQYCNLIGIQSVYPYTYWGGGGGGASQTANYGININVPSGSTEDSRYGGNGGFGGGGGGASQTGNYNGSGSTLSINNGSNGNNGVGGNAGAYTGGGGGGGWTQGGNGGTGIIVVAVLTSQLYATSGKSFYISGYSSSFVNGNYTIYTYLNSASSAITYNAANSSYIIYVLMVGGGGAGGSYNGGGGGGGGGFVAQPVVLNGSDTITVNVGGGGNPNTYNYGNNGGNSGLYFSNNRTNNLVAFGGGGGGAGGGNTMNGLGGASGGGGGAAPYYYGPASYINGQGYAGTPGYYTSTDNNVTAGGGGGAGGGGTPAKLTAAGNGGIGAKCPSYVNGIYGSVYSNYYWGGGGGGGVGSNNTYSSASSGNGGLGGGGGGGVFINSSNIPVGQYGVNGNVSLNVAGNTYTYSPYYYYYGSYNITAGNGATNTGGGGGGSAYYWNNNSFSGGYGGSGIVIIAILTSTLSGVGSTPTITNPIINGIIGYNAYYTTSDDYTVFIYKTDCSNAITYTNLNVNTEVNILAIGGGGGGGSGGGGGGGAGGFVQKQLYLSGSDIIDIRVGYGGKGIALNAVGQPINQGQNTSLTFTTNTQNNVIAYGGGYGATYNSIASSGGSGGGSTLNYGASNGVYTQGSYGGMGTSTFNDLTKLFDNNPPCAMYYAQNWQGYWNWDGTNWYSTLYDQIGGYHATLKSYGYNNNTQNASLLYDNCGNTYGTPIWYWRGTTTTGIDWPSFPAATGYTLCCITRYTGTANNRRIIQAANANFILGHWNTQCGVAFFNTWITTATGAGFTQNSTNWVVTCAKSGVTTPYNVISNGNFVGASAPVAVVTLPTLTINSTGQYTGEFSDWAFSHLAVWPSIISDNELLIYSNRLINYLATGESVLAPRYATLTPQIGYVSGGGGGGAAKAANNNNNYINMLFNKIPPWGAYCADNWSNNTLYEITGTGRHATTSGVTAGNAIGNGAGVSIPYIQGSTSARVNWPSGSVPPIFTYASITRYTGGTRGRILTDNGTYNLLHGHWQGKRGMVYYRNWMTQNTTSTGTLDNWLVTVGTNSTFVSTANNIYTDNSQVGTSNAAPINSYNTTLTINAIEQSDFQFNTLIIWDKALPNSWFQGISDWLSNYLYNGFSITSCLNRASNAGFDGGAGKICTLNGIKSYLPTTYWAGGGGGADISGVGGNGGAGGGGGGAGSTIIGINDISGYSINYTSALINSTGANGAPFTGGGGGGGGISGAGGDGGKGIVLVAVKSIVNNQNIITSASVTDVGPFNAKINFSGYYNTAKITRNGVDISLNAGSPYYETTLTPNTSYTYTITPIGRTTDLSGTPYTFNITTGSPTSYIVPYNIVSNYGLIYSYQFDLSYVIRVTQNNTSTYVNNAWIGDGIGAFYVYNYGTPDGTPSISIRAGRVVVGTDSITTLNSFLTGGSSYYHTQSLGLILPYNFNFSGYYGKADLTIVFWMYWTDSQNTPYVMSMNNNNYVYYINLISGTSGNLYFNQTGNLYYVVYKNTWYHVAFVHSGQNNTTSLFINGIKVYYYGSNPYYPGLNIYNSYIGSDVGGSQVFCGYFNDWRMYFRELSDSEIFTLYSYPLTFLIKNNATLSNQLLQVARLDYLNIDVITNTSVSLYFSGNYSTVSITRNGNTIVSNQSICSYIDTDVTSSILYTYTVIPYTSNNTIGTYKTISALCPSSGNNKSNTAAIYYNTGLYWQAYNNYFADDVTFPSSYASRAGSQGNKTSSGLTQDLTSLSTGTNGSFVDNSNTDHTFSVQWLGYFYTNQYGGIWSVSTTSDDASYLWIGANAVSGFTAANSTVNNGGLHGGVTRSTSISLTAYTYYPIRIQFGENGGGYSMNVTWYPPGGGSFANSYYNGNYYYYNKGGYSLYYNSNKIYNITSTTANQQMVTLNYSGNVSKVTISRDNTYLGTTSNYYFYDGSMSSSYIFSDGFYYNVFNNNPATSSGYTNSNFNYGYFYSSYTTTPYATGIVKDISSIANITNLTANFAVQIKGYFKPKTTGYYQFFFSCNDLVSIFFTGANAINAYYSPNVNLTSGNGLWQWTNVYLGAGTYYPFMLYYGKSTGTVTLQMYFKDPNNVTYYDGTGWYYNTGNTFYFTNTISSLNFNPGQTYTYQITPFDDNGVTGNSIITTVTIPPLINYYNIVDSSGLVLYYPFDVSYSINSSVYNYATGSPIYDANLISSTMIDMQYNAFGNACAVFNIWQNYYFSQYMTVTKTFTISPNGFAFSFWINTKGYQNGYIVSFTSDGSTRNSIHIYVSGNTLGFYIYYNYVQLGGVFPATSGSILVCENGWHHVAINVFNTGIVKLYTYGGTAYGILNNIIYPTNLTCNYNYIGTYGSSYFSGFLDEFRFYNRNLTDTEIMQLYNHYYNIKSPIPVLNSSTIINTTQNSLTLLITGVYDYVTIQRNGVLISNNYTSSYFVDNSGIASGTYYSYVVTPYFKINNYTGYPSIFGNSITTGSTTLVLGSSYNIIDPANLTMYYSFDISTNNNISLGNYATGTLIFDASMSNTNIQDVSNNIIGTACITTDGSSSKFITLPTVDTGSTGLTYAFWLKVTNNSPYNVISTNALALYYNFDLSGISYYPFETNNYNYINPSRLILYYPFDRDLLNYATGVGVSNASIINPGTTYGTNCMLTPVSYVGNGGLLSALSNSTTSYFSINTIPVNSFGYTFAFWFFPITNTPGMIFSFSNSTNLNNRIFCYFNGTVINIGTNTTSITTGYTPTLNQWNMFCWRFDTSANSTINTSYSYAGPPYVNYAFDRNYILGDPSGNKNSFYGYIDDFHYYDRIISDLEFGLLSNNYINYRTGRIANYASGKPVYDASYTSMLMIDCSNNLNTLGTSCLTAYGNATQVCMLPKITIDFNGFSISFWLRCPYTTSANRICEFKVQPGSDNNCIVLYYGGNSFLAGYIVNWNSFTSNVAMITSSKDISFNDTKWRHFVWTVTPAGRWRFYANGVKYYDTPGLAYPLLGDRVVSSLLSTCNGVNNYTTMNASVDEFRFYNRVLSDTEIVTLSSYTGPASLATNPPTNIMDFSTGQGITTNDININYANSNLYSYVNVDGSASIVNFAQNVNDGIWRHIIWTIQQNGVYNYYINGVLVYSTTGYYPKNITRNINALLTNYTNSLNGSIDEFRFYKRAILSSEAPILYNYPNSVIYSSNLYNIIPTSSLSLYYPFDDVTDQFTVTTTTGLTLYYTFDLSSVAANGINLGNYATGSYIYDASMTVTGLISTSNYATGTASILTDGNVNKYVILPSVTTGTSGLSFSMFVKFNVNSGYSIVSSTNLVMYYPLDSNINLTTGNGASGTVLYDASLSATNVISSLSSAAGGASFLSVSSSNTFINVTNFTNTTNGLSIAIWFNYSSSANYTSLYKLSNGFFGNAIGAYIYNNNVYFYSYGSAGSVTLNTTTSNYNNSTWYLLTVTATYASGTGATYNMYINSNQVATTTGVYPDVITRINNVIGYGCPLGPFYTVYVIGAYNMSPWGMSNTLAANAGWVWNDPAAASGVAANIKIHFCYVYYSASAFTATVYCCADDYTTVYINGVNYGTTSAMSTLGTISSSVAINAGYNFIDCLTYNTGGPAGFLFTMYNGSTNVLNTNSSWFWALDSAINGSASTPLSYNSSFNGYLDEFRVYNRVLTISEVSTIYNYRSLTSSSGGSANYNYSLFDLNASPTDITTNDIQLTIVQGYIYGYVSNNGVNNTIKLCPMTFDGNWAHILWTIDSRGTYTIYLNGIMQNTVTNCIYPANISRNYCTLLTNRYNSITGYFDGFRFYNNRVLTSTDAMKLSNLSYGAQNIIGNYATGYPVYDASVNSFNTTSKLTIVNSNSVFGGGSLYLNNNQYMIISKPILFDYTGLSFSTWVYFTSITCSNAIFSFSDLSGGSYNDFILWTDNAGTGKLQLYMGGSTYILSNTQLAINTWYHIALVCQPPGTFNLYINNVKNTLQTYNNITFLNNTYQNNSLQLYPQTSNILRTYNFIGSPFQTSDFNLIVYYNFESSTTSITNTIDNSMVSITGCTIQTMNTTNTNYYDIISPTNLVLYYPFDTDIKNYATGSGVVNGNIIVPTGVIYYNTGLYWQAYNGYFNNDVTFPNSYASRNGGHGSQTSNGLTQDIGNLSNGTNGNFVGNTTEHTFSVQWLGYFYTNQYGGNWTVSTNSDDASYLWIGTNALAANYNASNATVNNGNQHGMVTVSATVSLNAYTYYPLRIQFGENGGGYDMIVTWTPPGGSAFTNATGYYYNTGSYSLGAGGVTGSNICTIVNTLPRVGSGCLMSAANNSSYIYFNITSTIPANTGGYTFSFWFYMTNTSSGMLWSFSQNAANGNRIFVYNNAGNIQIATTSNTTILTPTLNQWYHIVWTLSTSGTSIVYINGGTGYNGSVTTYTSVAYVSYAFDKNYILSDPYGAQNPGMYGYIDEFRYYNRVITASEASILFNAGANAISGSNAIYFANGGFQSQNFFCSSTGYSVSLWFYRLSNYCNGSARLLQASYGINSAIMYDNSSNYLYFNNNGTNQNITGISNFSWYHLCAVYSATGTSIIYINGFNCGSLYGGPTANAMNYVTFGAAAINQGNLNSFFGYMDEIQIFNSCLTQIQVSNLYNNGKGMSKFLLYNFYSPSNMYVDDFRFYNSKILTDNEVSSLYNQTQNTPVIYNAYFKNVTQNSLVIVFNGIFNTVAIQRNGVTISNNARSPFTDTGIFVNYDYTYTLIPYTSSLVPGNSYVFYVSTNANTSSGYNAIDISGLINYYSFDFNTMNGSMIANFASGNAVYDASSNWYNIIDICYNKTGSGSLVLNSAYSQYVYLPTMQPSSINGMAIAFWFLSTSSINNGTKIIELANSSSGNNININILNNRLYVTVYIGTNPTTVYTNYDTNINDGIWRHFVWNMVGSQTSNEFDFYINGQLINYQYAMPYPNSVVRNRNYIGYDSTNNKYFNGKMDELRVYNRSLSQAEILQLYNYPTTNPIIYSANIRNDTYSSISINFIGSFNYVSIYRNGTLITNTYNSPYIDSNLTEGTSYNYSIIPFNANSKIPGNTYNIQTVYTKKLGTYYNAIDNSGLILYYPFDVSMTYLNTMANYSKGVGVYDSTLIGNCAVTTANYEVGTASLIVPDMSSFLIINNITNIALNTATVSLNQSATANVKYNIIDTSGLKLYYPFDLSTNTDVNLQNYASGVGINDASMNVSTLITNNLFMIGNGCLFLNGSNYVTLPSFTNTTNGMTFSMWFYLNITPNNHTLFSFSSANQTNTIRARINSSSVIVMDVFNQTTTNSVNIVTGIGQYSWYSFIITFSGAQGGTNNSIWKAYLNGNLVYTGNNNLYPPIVSRSRTYNFIGNNDYGYALWNGYIDDFRLYTRAITASEVNIIYNSTTIVTNTTNYITTTPTPSFTISNTGFSVALWIYVSSFNNNAALFEFGDGTTSKRIAITLYNNSYFAVIVGTNIYSPPVALVSNFWNHIVWTIDNNNNSTIYVSGLLIYQTTSLVYPTYINNVFNWIGSGVTCSNFVGYINDFRFYNRIITQQEVATLYFLSPSYIPYVTETSTIASTTTITWNLGTLNCAYFTVTGAPNNSNVPIQSTSMSLTFNVDASYSPVNYSPIITPYNIKNQPGVALQLSTVKALVSPTPSLSELGNINGVSSLTWNLAILNCAQVYVTNSPLGNVYFNVGGSSATLTFPLTGSQKFNTYTPTFLPINGDGLYGTPATLSSLKSSSSINIVSNNSLLFYYPLEIGDTDISGTILADWVSGSQQFDASLVSVPVLDTTTFALGSSSMYFDGTNYAVLPTLPASSMYSFSVWFKCNNPKNDPSIFDFNTSDRNNSIFLTFDNNANLQIGVWSGTTRILNWPTIISDVSSSFWYHVVLTISGPTVISYVNGSYISTNTMAQTLPIVSRGTNYLAKDDSGNQKYIGNIDDFRVYSRILTSNEVSTLYNTKGPGFTP